MLSGSKVLIVEDEALIAMEMADAVAAADGVVVGPFNTVRAALRSLQKELVGGAILDANLTDSDITPVALFLAKRRIPAVVYTGIGLPADLRAACPDFPVVLKPFGTERVIDRLSALMGEGPAAG